MEHKLNGLTLITNSNDTDVIKSLNADLRAVRADLAAAEDRVKALETENERLRNMLQPFADLSQRYKEFHAERPSVLFKDYFYYNEEAYEMLHHCIDVREALQAKEAE